jgi:hypothetical protein
MTVAAYPLGHGSAPPVSLGRRFAARLLDLPLALLVGVAVGTLTSADSIIARVLGFAVAIIAVVAVGAYLAATGYLPGGRLLRVRQVRVVDGRPAGLAGIAKYAVVSIISVLTGGIGYLVLIVLAAREAQHRGWHDQLTGLIVIDARGDAGATPPTTAVGADPGSKPWAPNSWEDAAWAPGAWSGGAVVVARPPAGAPVAGVVPVRFQGPAVDPSALPDSAIPAPGDAGPQPWSSPPAPAAEHLDTAHTIAEHPVSATGSVDPGAQFDVTVAEMPAPIPDRSIPPGGSHALRLPNGQLLEVSGVSLLGRQPAAHADHPGATLVRLDDPTRSISRTHLALGCGADGALWARDLNSANGTLIVDQRGVTTKAPPGVPLYLVPGSWVVVGGLTLQVIS